LDLNQELSDAEINSIRNSWLKNGVAIFPNHNSHITIMKTFV
jgi:hypothetical protein